MDRIKTLLKETISELFGVEIEPDFSPSPENIPADYSTNIAMRLAKILHQNPLTIANELSDKLLSQIGNSDNHPYFNLSVSAPGFLNFTLEDEFLRDKIADLSNNFEKNISSNKYLNKTVICEFSDPNPFKVLHVGHLYTSIVGDSIAKLFEYAGAKVIRANFGGDVGLHVAKTLYVLKDKPIDELKIEDIAKCYVEGTALYDDDEHAHAEIAKLNKAIYEINSKNLHDTNLAKLYWLGRELSYDYFNNFYAKIGVKFDKYYPESTVADLGLAKVRAELKNGVYEESDGAVVFRGDKFGLHTRVFINNNGVPTYETKDVGLIFTKWNDYRFDKSIVITGNEQLDYMKVVLKSVEQYAPDLVEKTSHLTHGLVKLPGNVKMSSRKGNFLKAVDVLELIETELESEYHSADPKIALAATKYAFLKYKMGGNIIFDPKESVKMTGNSGPYLLYSAVRAKKILEKVAEKSGAPTTSAELQPSERDLMKKILEYRDVLESAVSEMAPHKLANYLYELAQTFSRFYEKCPVSGSDNESERRQIVSVYLGVMLHGLDLLGIKVPEEM